jgi:hypothetical protein
MTKNIEPENKTTQTEHADDNHNDCYDMQGMEAGVVIIIITLCQSVLTSSRV